MEKKYYFGIDIGGTSVKCGLFDPGEKLLEKWIIPTRLEENGAYIVPDLVESLEEKMRAHDLNASCIKGLGVGVPGQVDEDGNVLLAENLGWEQVSLGRMLEEQTGFSVKAGNDANLAALGEYRDGSGAGSRSMMLVTLGTGVGCGIVVDGKILAGAHGAAGEIGHMHVEDRMQEKCSCGKSGCLEQLASARGLVQIAQQMEKGRYRSAREIFEAASKGESPAVRSVETFGAYLGKALAMCACVLDPEVIVLGGGVSGAGGLLVETVQKHYRRHTFLPCENTRFCLAELGNDAGIYGALRLIQG